MTKFSENIEQLKQLYRSSRKRFVISNAKKKKFATNNTNNKKIETNNTNNKKIITNNKKKKNNKYSRFERVNCSIRCEKKIILLR